MLILTEEEQKQSFNEIFDSLIEVRKRFNAEGLSTKEEWANNANLIDEMFKNKKVLTHFLGIQQLQSLFFMNSQGEVLRQQVHLLELLFSPDEIEDFVKESKLGDPPMITIGKNYLTTHNTVHHLYHLSRYYRQHSESIKNVETVIEWGGGYGNMCKVFFNFAPKLKTYVIFDLPSCSTLQYAYLSSLYGKDKVRICDDGKIVEGMINLMNFQHLDQTLNGDLFLSNWALSESPIECHDSVIELNWFNCEKLLLSFHQCGDHIPFMKESTHLGIKAKKHGAKIKDVKIIPGTNLYAFR